MKKLEKVFAAGLILFSLFAISSCKKKDKKENQTSIEKEEYSEEDGTVVKHEIEKNIFTMVTVNFLIMMNLKIDSSCQLAVRF